MTLPVIFVLGGARSGKSQHAERLTTALGPRPVYIATAEPGDAEMAERITQHQTRRGAEWRTIEAPLDLAGAITGHNGPDRPLMIDCLTIWLSNLMHAERDIPAETEKLITALAQRSGPVVLVSNEVGQGIVPDNALARRFRDEAGRMNQAVAAVADRVDFVVAGLPTTLKDE